MDTNTLLDAGWAHEGIVGISLTLHNLLTREPEQQKETVAMRTTTRRIDMLSLTTETEKKKIAQPD